MTEKTLEKTKNANVRILALVGLVVVAILIGLSVYYRLAKVGSGPGQAAVQLTLWEQEKDDVQMILDELIVRFQTENEGVFIKRSHFRTEDLRAQFQTAAIGGGGADFIIAPSDFAGPFSMMQIIKPMNDLVEDAGFDEGLLKTVQDNLGHIWGYPVARGNHLMLYSNKTLVKTPPETMEEMVSTARSITSGNVYGLVYNLTEPFWLVPFLGAFGASPLTNGQPNIGGQPMVDTLRFVRDLKFKEKVVPGDCDYACADTLFVEGKAGMIINGDWALGRYREALADNLEVSPLPRSEVTGEHMKPMVSGSFFFFNHRITPSKFEAAVAFAEFLASTEIQQYLSIKGGRMPVTVEATNSPEITGDPMLNASQAAMTHAQPMPMDIELRAVWDAMRPQLQNVMAGRAQPEAAAASMQREAERRIKEMGQ